MQLKSPLQPQGLAAFGGAFAAGTGVLFVIGPVRPAAFRPFFFFASFAPSSSVAEATGGGASTFGGGATVAGAGGGAMTAACLTGSSPLKATESPNAPAARTTAPMKAI